MNWPTVSLEGLTHAIEYGLTASATNNAGGPRFLRITDIQNGQVNWDSVPSCKCSKDDLNRYRLAKGDIVFARTGATTGKSFLIDECPNDSVFASYLIRIQPNDRVLPEYLSHYFQSTEYWDHITENAAGSAQPGVNATKLKALPIPLPPLPEQKRIVAILDEAFEAIATATANTEKNLANARELFQSKLHQEFSGSRQDQAVPEHSRRGDVVKAGWKLKDLNEVCTLVNGRAYKKPELLNKGKYPVLRVGNFFTNNHWYYSDLELEDSKYCDDGDLLYAWSASFGPRIWDGGKAIYHYHIWRVDFDSAQVIRDYLYYWFLWDAEKVKEQQGAGTTMVHVSMTSMNARPIPLPPLPEQKRIVAILDEAKDYSSNLELQYGKKSEQLIELRQSLLHSAFTGELTADYKAADRSLKEAGL